MKAVFEGATIKVWFNTLSTSRNFYNVAELVQEGNAALIMKEALEKQIPKKAYYLNYGGYNVGNWNHGIACICDYKAIYCKHCGQKLDWEVENE